MPNNLPVVVDDWSTLEEVYTVGARDKTLLLSPVVVPLKTLRSKHGYLFKKSVSRYPDQYWGEVVAYLVGKAMGIKVPPAYPALLHETPGALIEWFVRDGQRFVAGGDIMQLFIPDYERDKGRQHNFSTIRRFCQFTDKYQKSEFLHDWRQYWLESHMFDALIGNTDRHQENWGLLVENDEHRSVRKWQFAPCFDNGTALGHEIFANKFVAFDNVERISRYVNRGKPHMMWAVDGLWQERASHEGFLQQFLPLFPDYCHNAKHLLAFDFADLAEKITALCEIDTREPLTPARAEFMCKLLSFRLTRLKKLVDS